MARKSQTNPQLDMTPMIDVVFELIIFFVVTLTQANAKDETIRLEDGFHGKEIKPEDLPPAHLIVDIASKDKTGRVKPRISMNDVTVTKAEVGRKVKERMRKYGEFPVLIRADEAVPHRYVAEVMNACTENGVWKLSFVAIKEHKKHE